MPKACSHSPTSSSKTLGPDSKPSVWSHLGYAGIMIFCITAYCRFWKSGAYLLCISRHPSDRLDSQTDRDTAFRYQSQRVVRLYAALQMCITKLFLMPKRLDSARFRTCTSTVESLCCRGSCGSFISIERRCLPWASQSGFCSVYVDQRFQRTSFATMYDYMITV